MNVTFTIKKYLGIFPYCNIRVKQAIYAWLKKQWQVKCFWSLGVKDTLNLSLLRSALTATCHFDCMRFCGSEVSVTLCGWVPVWLCILILIRSGGSCLPVIKTWGSKHAYCHTFSLLSPQCHLSQDMTQHFLRWSLELDMNPHMEPSEICL